MTPVDTHREIHNKKNTEQVKNKTDTFAFQQAHTRTDT